jgi:hypothetical protein
MRRKKMGIKEEFERAVFHAKRRRDEAKRFHSAWQTASSDSVLIYASDEIARLKLAIERMEKHDEH